MLQLVSAGERGKCMRISCSIWHMMCAIQWLGKLMKREEQDWWCINRPFYLHLCTYTSISTSEHSNEINLWHPMEDHMCYRVREPQYLSVRAEDNIFITNRWHIVALFSSYILLWWGLEENMPNISFNNRKLWKIFLKSGDLLFM